MSQSRRITNLLTNKYLNPIKEVGTAQKLQWSSVVNIRRCTTGRTQRNTDGTEWFWEESTWAVVRRKGREGMREREGKGLEGRIGSEFTWWGSFSNLQALLASEQQAAWQKLAHGRDRLLGEFYHAPSAWALQTRVTSPFPLVNTSIQSLHFSL